MDENRARKIYLSGILSLAIVLRLLKWNNYSFWYDEVQWLVLSRDLSGVFTDNIYISKPPLFGILLFFWKYIGNTEFILRLLPFVLGVLSVFMSYKVGRVLENSKTGIFLSFLTAVSPFHIYYSQELTHYSLALLLTLCAVYWLIRCLQDDTIFPWVFFYLFGVLCLYTHYICLFFLLAANVYFFSSFKIYKKLAGKWIAAQLLILFSYLPALIISTKLLYILKSDYISSVYPHAIIWVPGGSLAHIFQAVRLFNLGYNADFVAHLGVLPVFTPVLLFGLYYNFKENRQKIKLVILWLTAPLILSVLLSGIIHTFTYRNFIFVLPAYYFIIASGIARLKRYSYIPLLSFCIFSAAALFNYYNNILIYPHDFYRVGVHPKSDNRAAAKYLNDNFKDGDCVIHVCHSTAVPFVYYNKSPYLAKEYTDKAALYHGEGLVLKNKNDLPRVIMNKRRVWLVYSFWEPNQPTPEGLAIKGWLNKNLQGVKVKRFTGIKVYLYYNLPDSKES